MHTCKDNKTALVNNLTDEIKYKLKELLDCHIDNNIQLGDIATVALIDENNNPLLLSSNKQNKPSILFLNGNQSLYSIVSTSVNAKGKCCVSYAGYTLCEGDGLLQVGSYWYFVEKNQYGKCCVYQAECQYNGAGNPPTIYNIKEFYCES